MPKRTTELQIKDATLESGDYLLLVDTGDPTDSPEGTDKRVQSVRIALTDGNPAQVTGGGGIDLGGHQVAFVKAGDVAMVDDLTTPSPHTHVEADITDLDKYTQAEADALLAGKSDTGHGHAIADVTGLQTALDGKEDNLSVTLLGTGSLDLGTSTLTTGDKSGEIATVDELGAQGGTFYYPLVLGLSATSGSAVTLSQFWVDSTIVPDGAEVNFGIVYEASGFGVALNMFFQTSGGGSNVTNVPMIDDGAVRSSWSGDIHASLDSVFPLPAIGQVRFAASGSGTVLLHHAMLRIIPA